MRRLVAEAKVPAYARLVELEMLGTEDKRVIMGHHSKPLRDIADYLEKRGLPAVVIQGGTPEAERVQAVERFQNGDARVFVGNIRAAGVGLTLTAAHHLDMFESDWSPAANAQALKRINRIGQTKPAFGRFISLAGSLDASVTRVVQRKTRNIALVEGAAMQAVPEMA